MMTRYRRKRQQPKTPLKPWEQKDNGVYRPQIKSDMRVLRHPQYRGG